MARAKAVALEHPTAGIEQIMHVASEGVTGTVKATVKGTWKCLYGTFYYTSFGVSYLTLSLFHLFLIGHNPIGEGIKDGAMAAGDALVGEKTKGGKRTRK